MLHRIVNADVTLWKKYIVCYMQATLMLQHIDMYAIELEQKRHANSIGAEPPQVRLHFKHGPDCRRYNEPSHDEVAIFIGDDGSPPENQDIVVYPRDGDPQHISYLSCHLDPMCYPLLFPRGDPGWHNDMVHVSEHQQETVTMQQFYGYRLAIGEEFSPIQITPTICC